MKDEKYFHEPEGIKPAYPGDTVDLVKDDGGNEIAVAIYALSRALRRNQIHPPTAIILPTPEDGLQLMNIIKHYGPLAGSPPKPMEMADGNVWISFNIVGVDIRWPANRKASPDGTWSYE